MVRARILVIDSDAVIRKVLHACLQADGLDVVEAEKCTDAEGILNSGGIDLITIETGNGAIEGVNSGRELRSKFGIPIVVISANTDRNVRNGALIEFADDYMAKPFDVHEVVARCRALLRRTYQPVRKVASDETRAAGLTLDVDGHQIIAADGKPVELSATEFKTLTAFVRNPNRVLSREHLLELSGGSKLSDSLDRAIDMRVRRLRRKLGDVGWNGSELITTIRGVGYIYRTQSIARRGKDGHLHSLFTPGKGVGDANLGTITASQID